MFLKLIQLICYYHFHAASAAWKLHLHWLLQLARIPQKLSTEEFTFNSIDFQSTFEEIAIEFDLKSILFGYLGFL